MFYMTQEPSSRNEELKKWLKPECFHARLDEEWTSVEKYDGTKEA